MEERRQKRLTYSYLINNFYLPIFLSILLAAFIQLMLFTIYRFFNIICMSHYASVTSQMTML